MTDGITERFGSPRRYGLLVIGPPFMVLYANEPACVFMRRLRHVIVGGATWGLPKELKIFCTDILEIIYDHHFDEVFTPFQVNRKVDLMGKPLLLRGVGHPCPDGLLESFAYIIMEEMLDRCEAAIGARSVATNIPSAVDLER